MPTKHHEKLSEQAMHAFLSRLEDFYDDDGKNSVRRLREDISRWLWPCYRNDEMIDTVFTRLVLVCYEEEGKGKKIRNFQGLVKRVATIVCHEEDRRIDKDPLLLLDEPSKSGADAIVELRSSVDSSIEQIKDDLKRRCYRHCLQRHAEMLEIFERYFPDEKISREGLAERRTQLAQETSKVPGSDPSQMKKTLYVQVFRWIKDHHLADCVRECFEQEISRHIELERLLQEQQRNSN